MSDRGLLPTLLAAGSPGPRHQLGGLLLRVLFWFTAGPLRGGRGLSGTSSVRALIPSMRAPPSSSQRLPEAHLLMLSSSGGRKGFNI